MRSLSKILSLASFILDPIRHIKKTAVVAGTGFAVGLASKKGKHYKNKIKDQEFETRYLDFMNYSKSNNIPKKDYMKFKSIYENSNNLDYQDKINQSLNIIEKMHSQGTIDKKKYINLKDKFYSNFKEGISDSPTKKNLEDYLPLAASILFLLSGAVFLTPNLTGFSVIENVSRNSLDFFGVVSFVLSLSFLLVFLRKVEKKRF